MRNGCEAEVIHAEKAIDPSPVPLDNGAYFYQESDYGSGETSLELTNDDSDKPDKILENVQWTL